LAKVFAISYRLGILNKKEESLVIIRKFTTTLKGAGTLNIRLKRKQIPHTTKDTMHHDLRNALNKIRQAFHEVSRAAEGSFTRGMRLMVKCQHSL
jgi:hypothetical protein